MRTVGSLVVLAGWSAVAGAQPAPTSASLFEEGRALLESGQPGPACERFEAALKLDADALGSILNLGLCNEERDRLATALRWFRRAQVRASEMGKPDTEAAAKDKTTTLAAKVPTIRIEFTHPPPTITQVALDDAPVAGVDYPRLEVDAGKHVIEVTIAGKQALRTELVIGDGEVKPITVPIAAPAPPVVPKPIAVVDRGAPQRQRAYILGGVGGALLIGDVVLGVIAKERFDATDMLDTRDRWRDTMRYGGTLLFLAGGAAVAGGVLLYLRAPKPEHVEVAPSVGANQVGLSVFGTF